MIFLILLTFLCLIPLVFVYLKCKWDSDDEKLGLCGPPTTVLLGNSWDIIKHIKQGGDVIQLFVDWCRQYDGAFRIRTLHKLIVFIGDAEAFEEFLNNPKVNKAFSYQFYANWLGQSTVISSGERWTKLRKLVTPAFHFQILEDFVKVFKEQSKILINRLEHTNGQCVDIIPFMQNYAVDVIGETAMGIKLNAQLGDKTNEAYTKACEEILIIIENRIFNPLFFSDFIWFMSPNGRREKAAIHIIHSFVNRVIERRREELMKLKQDTTAGSSINRRSALLDLLLNSSMDEKPLSDADIRGEVNTFMFAGYDTTTITTQFLLYNLAEHQNVQERVYQEIQTELNSNGEHDPSVICIRTINNLKYLDMCLKESLRMYSPVGAVGKETSEELKIGKMTIPSGTAIMPIFLHNHFNPKYFPSPHEFIPERFDTEVTSAERHPYSYTPFSAGLRNCVGQKFGVLEVKTIIIELLMKFKIELGTENFKPDTFYRGLLRSKNGVQLKFIPRQY